MLKSNPDGDPAAGFALPVLDQGLVHIERIEIVVVGMLTHIWHSDKPVTDRLGGTRAAIHEAPHIDNRGCAGSTDSA